MNEMLGNQYFITRRFKEAITEYEQALITDPDNDVIKKKLVICYIQQGTHKLALQLFTQIISRNIHVILNSDPVKDDCPCKKLICDIESSRIKLNLTDKCEMLGMLWLYCDIIKSRKYFNKLLKIDPQSTYYKVINNIINKPFSIN